ncbi:ComF family protein [Staphylococcus americanisciuri]|uniref:ComF family protein n=1 Tax=Staphylococcus americanisciuri TaxID=2973940 RepID=A0ABT2F4K6_9STAP|nr:ComF family protein [Staphylococcus americanisciuri]MCS4487327.1 ComF family protein [Staphylococcus americanisciuri]
MTCEHLSDCLVRFDHIYAPFCYDGLMKALIQQYKFMRDVALSEVIARYMIWPPLMYDLIVPMPSSPDNDQARTFNPVKYVLNAQGIDYCDILIMHNRHKQFDLTKKERFRIANRIALKDEINLENKRILLVDDIYTTGRTAHNAAVKLFHSKIRKLDMLTFAR